MCIILVQSGTWYNRILSCDSLLRAVSKAGVLISSLKSSSSRGSMQFLVMSEIRLTKLCWFSSESIFIFSIRGALFSH